MTTVERTIQRGVVRGTQRMGVDTFRGIRYAEPPKRFRPSVLAADGCSQVLDAAGFGPRSMQPPAAADPILGTGARGELSEDCLVLNVHVPASAPTRVRPVLVWIHGGSFMTGSANDYDASALALSADAVVVVINYRLGLFGQADVRGLGEGYRTSCNLWLGDQITALHWVRDNIAGFGGDPTCVTVMGQSAGATSTLALAASPATRGLLHRAIAFSPALVLTEDPQQPTQIAELCAGINADDVAPYLLHAPAEELVRLTAALQPQPWIDGIAIADSPHLALSELGPDGVPLLTGMVANEGGLLEALFARQDLDDEILAAMARSSARMATDGSTDSIDGYLDRRQRSHPTAGQAHLCSLIWTDIFRRSSTWAAAATTKAGAGGWHYIFDVPCTMAQVALTSAHGVCLPFTFNWFIDEHRTLGADWLDYHDPDLKGLATDWVAMIASFARHGAPQVAGQDWPHYGPGSNRSLTVTATTIALSDACSDGDQERTPW